jgi:hypothetical protein
MLKKKLSKEHKKYIDFHLPIQQRVIVPSTTGADKPIPKTQLKKRVQNVRKYLSQTFGGYTSTKGTGGYYSDDKKKVIKEKVVVVTSFGTKKAYSKNKGKVIEQLGNWGKKWGQESVGYEHEGDLYYIKTPKGRTIVRKAVRKKRKISPKQRKIMLKNLTKARRVRKKKKR